MTRRVSDPLDRQEISVEGKEPSTWLSNPEPELDPGVKW